jgi:3-oxoacyl-[acyl-carrier-protein] synthase II
MFGNLLGASGAVDLIVAALAIKNKMIPPTLNLDDPDPAGMNYVRGDALESEVKSALLISRGRGGINAAMVIEKP